MLEINNIKIPLDIINDKNDELKIINNIIEKELFIDNAKVYKIIIKKRSIDARNKNNIFIVFNIIIYFNDKTYLIYLLKFYEKKNLIKKDQNSINAQKSVNYYFTNTKDKLILNFYDFKLNSPYNIFFVDNNYNKEDNSIKKNQRKSIYFDKDFLYKALIEGFDLKKFAQILLNNLNYSKSVFLNKIKAPISNLVPIIIGCGPAGIFCALLLSYTGFKPIIIEQGDKIEERDKKVKALLEKREFDQYSNIQFGHGGAGTYSDGKLTTSLNNELITILFNTLIKFGANEDILYSSTPHIGTDILKKVVINICNEVENFGGKIFYNLKLIDFDFINYSKDNNYTINSISNNNFFKLKCLNTKTKSIEYFETDTLILATGNAAKDIYRLLISKNIKVNSKPFSIGVRIEHKREMLENSIFGRYKGHPSLPSAVYKLATHFYDENIKRERGVYTFCMCPGGYVIPSTTEFNSIVVNGMSYHRRDGENSNSAILVDIKPEDYNIKNPLEYILFQENIEKKAYQKAYNIDNLSFNAPGLFLEDFLNDTLIYKNLFYKKYGNYIITPTYKPGVSYTNFYDILPNDIIYSLKKGIIEFNKKINNFSYKFSFLTGVETRSSAPVWILRDDNFMTNINNLFAIGEGSGYAGGIVSSALDGINLAIKFLIKY